jgi:hypothetical protein
MGRSGQKETEGQAKRLDLQRFDHRILLMAAATHLLLSSLNRFLRAVKLNSRRDHHKAAA